MSVWGWVGGCVWVGGGGSGGEWEGHKVDGVGVGCVGREVRVLQVDKVKLGPEVRRGAL